MKSFLIKKVLLTCCASVFVLFTGCQNFMNGKAFMTELDDALTEASREENSISIFAYNSYGTLVGETGGTYKVGDKNLKLEFSENEGYQFMEWQVTNGASEKTGCSKDDAIYIKDPFNPVTTFTINSSANNYRIEAVCMPRPVVEIFSPIKIDGGVNADSVIEITFSHAVSKYNFVFTQKEFESYGKIAEAIKATSEDGTEDIIGIVLAGKKYFKGVTVKDKNGVALENHFNAPVLSEDGKKLTIAVDNSCLFNFSESSVKEICVEVAKSLFYDYTAQNGSVIKVEMGQQNYSASYNISASTSSKAKITFTAKDGDNNSTGTLSYNGEHSFNIGQSIKVEFEPNDAYNFISWNISDSTGLDVKQDGTNLYITVLNVVDNVEVKPVCSKKGTATFSVITNIGTVSPAGTNSVKVGDVITLTYNGNNDYYFPGWIVVNSAIDEVLTREQVNQYFECEDWSKTTITVRIKKESAGLEIAANSYLRPHVFSHEPVTTSEDAVTQDTNIKVYFDSDIDEASLYFTADEEYNLKKQDPNVVFESDEKGKYAYTLSNGQFYYKNLTLENRVTGENLSKYYNKPYLLEDKRTMIIPVNKVMVTVGGVNKPDLTLLPPGGIEIFVQFGTAFGFYADDNLIPLARDTNLTWIYSTKDGCDEKVPSIKIFTAKGQNTSTTIDFVTNSNRDPGWMSNNLKYCYLKDNKLTLNLSIKDDSKNLSEVYLYYTRGHDENLSTGLNEETKKYSLNFKKDSTIFTITDRVIDLKEITGKDGTYRLQLVALDDSGNKCESGAFYVRIDNTPPVQITHNDFKLFKKYKNMKFEWQVPSNLNGAEKPINRDLEKIELLLNGNVIKSVDAKIAKAQNQSTEVTPTQAGTYQFIAYDIFGNKAESEVFQYDLNIPYGSMLYSDQWTLDWWNYDNCNYTDFVKSGQFAVGHVGHNYTINDKNITIFNISESDENNKCPLETAKNEAKAENRKIDDLNSSFRTEYGIDFKLPVTSNYTSVFGEGELYLNSYKLMQDKLNFAIYSGVTYWLNESAGTAIHPRENVTRTMYRTVQVDTTGVGLSTNFPDFSRYYRLISNFTFKE